MDLPTDNVLTNIFSHLMSQIQILHKTVPTLLVEFVENINFADNIF